MKIFLFRQKELGDSFLACLAKFINVWNTILFIEQTVDFWLQNVDAIYEQINSKILEYLCLANEIFNDKIRAETKTQESTE